MPSIWASDWAGTGTEEDPYLPSAVDPSFPYRAVSFPECAFVNDFGRGPADSLLDLAPTKVIYVADTIDQPIPSTICNQVKAKFNFTIIPGDTLRQTAAKRGVIIDL